VLAQTWCTSKIKYQSKAIFKPIDEIHAPVLNFIYLPEGKVGNRLRFLGLLIKIAHTGFTGTSKNLTNSGGESVAIYSGGILLIIGD
jgi:hypothetical protein